MRCSAERERLNTYRKLPDIQNIIIAHNMIQYGFDVTTWRTDEKIQSYSSIGWKGIRKELCCRWWNAMQPESSKSLAERDMRFIPKWWYERMVKRFVIIIIFHKVASFNTFILLQIITCTSREFVRERREFVYDDKFKEGGFLNLVSYHNVKGEGGGSN